MNKKIKMIIAIILVIVVIAGIVAVVVKKKKNINTPQVEEKEITEVPISEIEEINIEENEEIDAFYRKYYGKTISVEGLVYDYGEEYYTSLGSEFATGVNILNPEGTATNIVIYGVTYDEAVANKIKSLESGKKIKLIGAIPNPDVIMSMPVELYLEDIQLVD